MTEFNKENTDDWKEKLRSAFISAFSGNPQENIQVYTEVGYYYMCCAPSSLYKYYSDRQEKLETVKHNKMWYSAPCNFNDVFDCDMSMDEEGIFQSILQMYPDKRGIREGSPIWRDLLKTCRQQIRTFQSSYDILKSRMGISCLSESDDSLLMWAHYANNHCGICVEYELLEINRQLGFSPVPIIYSDDRVCVHTLDPNTLEKDSKTRRLGYSIEGKVLKRKSNDKNSPDYKHIEKAVITGVAITHMPKNPKTFANIIKGEIDDDFNEDEEKEKKNEELIIQ